MDDYDRMEIVELCAKMSWLAKSMGGDPSLGPEQRRAVLDLMGK